MYKIKEIKDGVEYTLDKGNGEWGKYGATYIVDYTITSDYSGDELDDNEIWVDSNDYICSYYEAIDELIKEGVNISDDMDDDDIYEILEEHGYYHADPLDLVRNESDKYSDYY